MSTRFAPGARALLVTLILPLALTSSVHADPLFSAPFLSFDTGQYPTSVVIADLNADGRVSYTHLRAH